MTSIRECPECGEEFPLSMAVRLNGGASIICPECSAILPALEEPISVIEDSTANGFDPTAYYDR